MISIQNDVLTDSKEFAITIPRIPACTLEHLQISYARELEQLFLQFTPEKVKATLQLPLLDKRFNSKLWQQSALHHMTAALYLLQARYLQAMADAVDADTKIREHIRLMTTQWTAALSPANFLSTNPEVQHKLIETNGASLYAGILNFLSDMAKGRVSQTDEQAFELGKNIACTPGEVIFENAFFQLLQYYPSTSQVYACPLLIVPPCINKYYILDLQPENSFVRYAISQGHTVFLISWRNPDDDLKHASWDDYIEKGVIQAIEVASNVCAQPKVNLLGFCVGGTMASMAMAVLAARQKSKVASLTLLTTFLDFSKSGALGALVNEQQVRFYEKTLAGMHKGEYGLMSGASLANIFSSLRPEDLIWHYVVENYLKGQPPKPFDLLYWNSDSTNLPGPMYAWYLRHLYLENGFIQAGKLCVCGEKIDINQITVPVFVYGAREDHIVPWPSVYASAKLLQGPCHFVLGASGHIAGVISPPGRKQRSYWKNTHLFNDHADWLAHAEHISGSWWPEWNQWLITHAGEKNSATQKVGGQAHVAIEPAPGTYVKQKTA